MDTLPLSSRHAVPLSRRLRHPSPQLFDEIDTIFGEVKEHEALRSLLNADTDYLRIRPYCWAFLGRLAAVPKKLVRRGRVCGYRPTRAQLEELLELAQRGIDDANASAHLSYWQGDQQISPRGSLNKVLPGNLDEIINDASPKTRELSNLSFDISQDGPIERSVSIEIQPDSEWTTYEVKSDDQTWAFGRHHELTDKLLNDRNLYSKAYSARPEVPRKGAQSSWRPGTWEVVDDLRIKLVKLTVWSLLWLPPLTAALYAAIAYSWYYPGGKTHADLVEHQNAITMIDWANKNKTALIIIGISYLFGLLPRNSWLASLRKSGVMLEKSGILSRYSFLTSQNAAALGTFYVSILILLIAIITLIIG